MKKPLAVFDLDGTLYDATGPTVEAPRETLRRMGPPEVAAR